MYKSGDICEEESLFPIIATQTGMGVLVFMVLTMGFEFCIGMCVCDWNCNLHDSGLFGFEELAVHINFV